jgi:putative SbcD/Mre11-related phosphoesterase
MDIQPVYNIPALRIDDTYIIADLHIGVESHLMKKGFHLTSRTEEMFNTIFETSDGCDHLIVLGDVKDSVPGSSRQEYKEIPSFFERLMRIFDMIDVVRGNHDTSIEEFLPKGVRIRPSTGMKIGDVGYVHGHTWPSAEIMDCKTLVMAHEHPAVMFRDGVGKQTNEPCWIRGKFRESCERYPILPEEFIIVPSFNRMLGGSPMNVNNGKFLNPLLTDEYLDIDNAEMFLLDGINLGRRCDNMVDDRYEMRNLKRGPRGY